MRVGLLTTQMEYGAFCSVFSGVAHALAENGVSHIDLLTTKRDTSAAVNPFPSQARPIRLPGGGSAGAVLPLRRYLERDQPDVLISGPILPNLAAAAATCLARRWRGTLVLGHYHPIGLARGQTWKNNQFLVRLLYRFADGSFAVNPSARDEAIEVARLDPARVACIPIPLAPPPPDLDMECDHPWLGSDRPSGPVFVTVSRLDPVKNITLLLDAFADVAERLDAKLLVIGRGPLRDDLQAQIDATGLRDRADLLGFVPSPQPYLRAADVFVLASDEEGFGQVSSEAMAEGLPVIGTDAAGGGTRFVLDEGRAGVLVPRGDRRALADAMARMADSTCRERYARLAKRRAESFAPARIGKDLLAFIAYLSSPDPDR